MRSIQHTHLAVGSKEVESTSAAEKEDAAEENEDKLEAILTFCPSYTCSPLDLLLLPLLLLISREDGFGKAEDKGLENLVVPSLPTSEEFGSFIIVDNASK